MSRAISELVALQMALGLRSLRRTLLVAMVYAMAGLLGVAAIGCGVASVWIAMVPHAGQAGAALFAAVVLVGLAVSLVLAARSALRRRPVATALTTDDLSALFAANKGAILASVLAAGFAAGARKG